MFDVKNKGCLDYNKFDKIDTDVLKAFLQADFDASEAEQMDVDTMLYITNILMEREKAENKPQIDVVAAREEFNKEYLPLLDKLEVLFSNDIEDNDETQTQEAATSNVILLWHKIWRKFASVAAVFVLVLFSGTITAYAFGCAPLAAIARWSDSQFWFENENTSATNELIVTLRDYGIEEQLAPTWLPAGYKMESIYVSGKDYQTVFNAIYTRLIDNTKEELSINIVIKQDSDNIIYEIDNQGAVPYNVNDIDHYIMDNLGQQRIVWQNADTECYISGDFTEREAKKMVNSIYKEKK